MIGAVLHDIDAALANNFAGVFARLGQSATDETLNRLQEKCFGGEAIPADFQQLYQWHNGQSGSGALNQADNYAFMPIDAVIEAWEFLNDPMEEPLEPISKSWIPFADNGGGDYRVYEIATGNNQGKILNYWHDDVQRPIVSESLLAWAQAVLSSAQV
jgi:cell wall assembly regulator SMI1